MQQQSYFDTILDNILELPLWVKQAIFVELKNHIKGQTPFGSIDTVTKHNLLQLFRPHITQAGMKVLRDRNFSSMAGKDSTAEDMFSLLKLAEKKCRIIDICQTYTWTLSRCAKVITDCIEVNLLEVIQSNYLSSTVYFLAGKIRIGEYLVRTGKISVEQLDMALYSQKYTEKTMGERILLAQILINLRYITPDDYENLIFLKNYGEELYSAGFNDNIADVEENVENLKKELVFLKKERLKLRENLSHFSEDAQTIASLLTQIDKHKAAIDNIQSENEQAKKNLEFYLNELVALTQENYELREKAQPDS